MPGMSSNKVQQGYNHFIRVSSFDFPVEIYRKVEKETNHHSFSSTRRTFWVGKKREFIDTSDEDTICEDVMSSGGKIKECKRTTKHYE